MDSTTNLRTKLQKTNVIVAKNITITNCKQVNLADVIDEIRSDRSLADLCGELRSITNKNTRQEFKKTKLPYFLIGEFKDNHRSKYAFISTQHMVFDIDGVSESELESIFTQTKNHPSVMVAFRSPSGNGLKFICQTNEVITSAEKYTAVYNHYSEKFSEELGVKLDGSTNDPSRACYFSSDADLYCNEDWVCLEVVIPEPKKNGKRKKESKDDVEFWNKIQNGCETGEERTPVLMKLIGRLIYKGLNDQEIQLMAEAWNAKNAEPLDDEKLSYTINDAFARYAPKGIEEKVKNFYSNGTGIWEARVIGDEFIFSNIGKEKFFIKVGANDETMQERYLEYVVKNKDILGLMRIDYVSDVTAKESTYQNDKADGCIFTVNVAPAKVKVQDNAFIENYLDAIFGDKKEFIKKWMAVYCFTNYRKLPALILTGGRGTSKTTFAEMVASIYPTLSSFPKELEGNFNPDADKKLIVIDESDSNGKMQYKTLKKYSGQKFVQINKKFMPQYQVKNNMNIMILSNDDVPTFVEREEMPTDEFNNQFFVYKMKPLNTKLNPDLLTELSDRVGHYARTELKTVFESLSFDGCRYSIPVPITKEERKLFRSSATDIEREADMIIQKLVLNAEEGSAYKKYLELGLIPIDFFNNWELGNNKTKIIRDLQRRGFIENETIKKQIDGKRFMCYQLTQKWLDEAIK